jgi:hypothetical protein
MNTLTINSKAALTLARATERARTEKPLVRKTATYGWYMVRSGSDMSRWYSVVCNSENKTITCNCSSRKPCKHIACVAPLHSWIARQRQEAEKAASQAAPVEQAMSLVELNDLIEQAIEKSDEQANAIVQTDGDYPDLLEPINQATKEYTKAQALYDRACLFG